MKVKVLWLVASGNYDDHSDGRGQSPDSEERQENGNRFSGRSDDHRVHRQYDVEHDKKSGEGTHDVFSLINLGPIK